MNVKCIVEIGAPADLIFACVDEPDKIEKWVEGIVDHKYTAARNEANPVGTPFHQRLKQGKRVLEFDGQIIAWEKPTHFGLRIPTKSYSTDAHFHISPVGQRSSRLEYTLEVTLNSLGAKVIGSLIRMPLGFFVKRQMNRLKHLAEALQAQRN
jgi:hypothetical protein